MQIQEETYLTGLEECNNHLHNRIVLVKGDKPLIHLDVCKKLELVLEIL